MIVTIAANDDALLESDPEVVPLNSDTPWTTEDIPEVDVTILENECGVWSFVAYDFDENCYVDLADAVKILEEWLMCSMPNDALDICVDTR